MIDVKLIKLPYEYGDNDRFYDLQKVESDFVDSTTPTLSKSTIDEKNDWTLELKTTKDAILKTKQTNFNSIIIDGLKIKDKTKSVWMVVDVSQEPRTTQDPVFVYSLKLDIFLTFDLLRNTTTKRAINITQKLHDNLEIDEYHSKLVVAHERNPRVWNNKDFDNVIPNKMKVKPFSLSPILEATDKTFENGNIIYKVPKKYKDIDITFEITWTQATGPQGGDGRYVNNSQTKTKYNVKLSPFVSIIKELIKTSNYVENGGELSNVASLSTPYVNDELNVYNATSLAPVVYSIPWKKNDISPTYRQQKTNGKAWDNSKISFADSKLKEIINSTGNYTCEWGNTINFTDTTFSYLLRRVLLGALQNDITKITANKNLVNINMATDWLFDLPEPINGKVEATSFLPYFDDKLIPRNLNSDGTINSSYQSGYDFADASTWYLPIDLNRNAQKAKAQISLNKKIELDINAELFTQWEKYKNSQPQLFANKYNPIYINILEKEIPLKNYQMFRDDKLFLETWIGTGEQNISIYQGEFGVNNEILEPQNVNKIAFGEPVEYSKDAAAISYELQRNYLAAKRDGIAIANSAQNRQISAQTDATILANRANQYANVGKLSKDNEARITAIQSATTLKQREGAAKLILGLVAAPFTKGFSGIAALEGGISLFTAGKQSQIAVQQQQSLTAAAVQQQTQLTEARNTLALANEKAAISRANSDADVRRIELDGQIADILNQPNVIENSTLITKALSMEKGQISLIERFTDDYQQKSMWEYWNKFGLSVWKSFKLKPHSIKKLVKDVWTETTPEPWYKEFALFDFFKGGDWTPYLNKIGVFDIDIINEFNFLMFNGVRLHHQDFTISTMINNSDIHNEIPNYSRKNVATILPNY